MVTVLGWLAMLGVTGINLNITRVRIGRSPHLPVDKWWALGPGEPRRLIFLSMFATLILLIISLQLIGGWTFLAVAGPVASFMWLSVHNRRCEQGAQR